MSQLLRSWCLSEKEVPIAYYTVLKLVLTIMPSFFLKYCILCFLFETCVWSQLLTLIYIFSFLLPVSVMGKKCTSKLLFFEFIFFQPTLISLHTLPHPHISKIGHKTETLGNIWLLSCSGFIARQFNTKYVLVEVVAQMYTCRMSAQCNTINTHIYVCFIL